jgi:hypothetical protein
MRAQEGTRPVPQPERLFLPTQHAWIAPVASITTFDGAPIDWPDTHQLLIARR